MTKKVTVNQVKKIIIIGAGLGGLAAGCRLAKLGYSVTIIEQNNQVGGKASELVTNGFRFDRGPSFMTMIDVFEDLFLFCGRKLQDYIDYKPLNQTVEYHWTDGSSLTTYNDIDKTIEILCNELGENKQKIEAYLSKIKLIYDLSKPYALDQAIDFDQVFNYEFLGKAMQLLSIDLGRTLSLTHKKVFKNPKTRQIFNRWAAYVYSDPSKTPSILSSIGWAELGLGLYLPTQGIHSIATGIARLATELGVNIILDTKVVNLQQNKELAWNYDTITTLGRLDSGQADIVISNLDIHTTYDHLLKKEYNNPKKPGASYLIYYWGIKHHPSFDKLQLHNIFFGGGGGDSLLEFREQFDSNRVASSPMVYLNITSRIIEKDSPYIDGQKAQNWISIISTPPDNGLINWKDEISTKKQFIQELIAKSLNIQPVEIDDLILCEHIMTPPDIQNWTGSWHGDLSGMRIESVWDVITRPKVEAKGIKNLYFVGGTINPGPGMPMVLLSAKHCAEIIGRE